MQTTILCDFDGTVVTADVQHVILNHYTGDAWVPINEAWRRGEVSTEERARQQWALVHTTEGELAALVTRLPLDPTFPPFVAFCRERGYELAIVSDGFDFYIERILAVHGLSAVPFTANHLAFQNGRIELTFINPNPVCCRLGNCKRRAVERLRPPNGRVVYVGDGLSDACGADAADLVFAKGLLASYCQEHSIPFRPFHDFADIMADREIATEAHRTTQNS
jgi:2,3-diketo-5-methylthio-1-phosphopentane phosphatase